MNDIERKYYDAFEKYLKTKPTVIIFTQDGMEQFASIKLSFDSSTEHEVEEAIKSNDVDFVEYAKRNLTDSMLCGANITSRKLHKARSSLFINNHIPVAFAIDYPKKDISGYKPDFLISFNWYYQLQFAVEIDGHEWHEKTKEQASNDRKKDRAYLKNLTIPIRFTGSDVYHDAMNCVRETMEISLQFLIHQFCIDLGIEY